MAAFDRLPPDLRAWLRDAALPWSPRSCLAIWEKARREGLDHRAALARLDAIEKAMLTRR
ncbi:hypothetical protein TW80_10875 [Loktanella sp. S4079]|nr:hypothetical protein TW80_10875 [Loktanella sp. S4079]